MMELQVFEYEGSPITFEFDKQHQMINATEMAKPFGKLVGGEYTVEPCKDDLKGKHLFQTIADVDGTSEKQN